MRQNRNRRLFPVERFAHLVGDLPEFRQIGNGHIIIRSNAVATHRLGELQRCSASLLLYPDVDHIHWADFSQLEAGVQAGRDCARDNNREIRKLAKRAKWKGLIGKQKPTVREISI